MTSTKPLNLNTSTFSLQGDRVRIEGTEGQVQTLSFETIRDLAHFPTVRAFLERVRQNEAAGKIGA